MQQFQSGAMQLQSGAMLIDYMVLIHIDFSSVVHFGKNKILNLGDFGASSPRNKSFLFNFWQETIDPCVNQAVFKSKHWAPSIEGF